MLTEAIGMPVLLSYNLEIAIGRNEVKNIVEFVKAKV